MLFNPVVYCDRLKQARLHRGYSQTELAKLARVRQSTIGNLESGKNKSSTHTATFAAILRCNATWLATGEGEPEYDAPHDVDYIVNEFRNFDPDRRQALLDYIRILQNLGPGEKFHK